MEISNAIALFGALVNNKQQEIDALNLAIKVLQNQFQPELTRMNNAEAQVISLITRSETAEKKVTEKEAIIQVLIEEKRALQEVPIV